MRLPVRIFSLTLGISHKNPNRLRLSLSASFEDLQLWNNGNVIIPLPFPLNLLLVNRSSFIFFPLGSARLSSAGMADVTSMAVDTLSSSGAPTAENAALRLLFYSPFCAVLACISWLFNGSGQIYMPCKCFICEIGSFFV